MPDPTYDVAVRLSLVHFDDRRAALATVRRVVREVRSLRRLDPDVARVRSRRCGRSAVELTVRVTAPTSWAAFDRGRAVVRASIHAVGGGTSGWERLTPEVRPPGRRGAPRAPSVPSPSPAPGPSSGWAAISAHAKRRVAGDPSLPPFAGAGDAARRLPALPPLPAPSRAPLGEVMIDLR